MPKSMMMLVNPAAGRTTSRNALGSAVEAFCFAGYSPTVYFTTGPRTGTELAARYAHRYETLVCLGGDGTLSDAIAGLMRIPPEQRPRLGYIPMGTANDVANTLNLPLRRPAAAAEDILAGKPMPFDVGKLGEAGYFTYVAAFGAFTEVSYKTDQELKHLLGHAAYLLSGISYLPKLKSYPVRIEYDGGVLEEPELVYGAVSNSTSIAGLVKLDKRVVALSDGLFELVVVRRPRTLGELSNIVSGALNQDYSGPSMSIYQTSRARFLFQEPVAWTRDGEAGGEFQELEIQNLHHAIQFIR